MTPAFIIHIICTKVVWIYGISNSINCFHILIKNVFYMVFVLVLICNLKLSYANVKLRVFIK